MKLLHLKKIILLNMICFILSEGVSFAAAKGVPNRFYSSLEASSKYRFERGASPESRIKRNKNFFIGFPDRESLVKDHQNFPFFQFRKLGFDPKDHEMRQEKFHISVKPEQLPLASSIIINTLSEDNTFNQFKISSLSE